MDTRLADPGTAVREDRRAKIDEMMRSLEELERAIEAQSIYRSRLQEAVSSSSRSLVDKVLYLCVIASCGLLLLGVGKGAESGSLYFGLGAAGVCIVAVVVMVIFARDNR